MSDWAVEKAFEIHGEKDGRLIGTSNAHLLATVQSLREARAEGMREAAQYVDGIATGAYQSGDMKEYRMLASLADTLKKIASGEDSKP